MKLREKKVKIIAVFDAYKCLQAYSAACALKDDDI